MSGADWQPTAAPAALRLRAQLNATLRQFFAERAVLEVETPLLSRHGTTDRHIESFCVEAGREGERRWLRTSPEFALKRLLAAGLGDCYELGRVFRRGEAGRRHNPEFSLLEWYRVGWDHHRLISEVEALVDAALALVGRRVSHRRIGYRELFQSRLGIDPLRCDDGELRARMPALGVDPDGLQRDDLLDLLFTHALQPQMAADQLLTVIDYPASQCALARLRRDGEVAVAERFESYLGTLELCNGYHELLDASEQAERFAAELRWRETQDRSGPPADAQLLAAMQAGLPACAGVALGTDRLLAAMLGGVELAAVIAFPFERA